VCTNERAQHLQFNSRKEAWDIVGSLSGTTKMPCKGYSLPASMCQVGSRLREIKGSICSTCYAHRGNNCFKTVQATYFRRLHSLTDVRWCDAMVYLIGQDQYFRWHESGDLQGVWHFQKIVEVAKRTPHTLHWLPTREYAMIKQFVEAGFKIPKNLTVRLSAYRFEERGPEALARKLGVQVSTAKKTGYNCFAKAQDNTCGECRNCWNQKVFDISYHRH
jgi:hypothetical protein